MHDAVKELCELFSSINVKEKRTEKNTLMELKEIAIVLDREGHDKESDILSRWIDLENEDLR